MQKAFTQLPDDIESLREFALNQVALREIVEAEKHALKKENSDYKTQVVSLETRVLTLQEQLNLALARRYAASSEKLSPDQIRLFDEAEAETQAVTAEDNSVIIPEHSRHKRGRQKLPEALPRVDVIHDIPEAERHCPHDGKPLTEMGEVTSEQLDIIPAKIQVIRHVRKQYACSCGQCIKTAPLPKQPIPKSLASPGLLAHITVSKYQDALPLYRQEKILQRIGIDLPRATLSNWMIQAGQLIQPLINLLQDRLLSYDIVQMDETPVQVLKEPNKRAQSKSYLWVQRGGPPAHPVILYDYDPGRGAGVPQRLLAGFSGYLQTDGYDGYNAAVAMNGLTHVGCLAHARRKFSEAIKAQGKKKKKGRAQQGLIRIQQLYRVEQQARSMTPPDRYATRRQHAQPIFDELRIWLDQALPQIPPKSATGKALNYLNHEWEKLIRYLEDGRLEIDNNLAENAIRPFVVGRKNWLFSDSVKGVKASANLYSLIETAKANGREPYAYLRHVFTELPKAQTVAAIEALLPMKCNTDQISPR
jgi:transposase